MDRTIIYSPRAYSSFLQTVEGGKAQLVRTASGVTQVTREITNAHLVLRNPLDRLVTDRHRRMNIAFAVAEFAGLFAGEDSAAYYSQFINGYGKYSSRHDTIVGAYGPRLLEHNQISAVIARLHDDLYSRRGVLTIYSGSDLVADPRDVPCTLSIQFLYREALDAIVTMRSSDAYWGLTYDIFQFSMLQEFVARNLGVEPGSLYLNAGSLHIYEDFVGEHTKMIDPRWPFLMQPMPLLNEDDIIFLWVLLRDIADTDFWMNLERVSTQYVKNLVCAARAWSMRVTNPEDAKQAYFNIVGDKTLRKIVRPALEMTGVLDRPKRATL